MADKRPVWMTWLELPWLSRSEGSGTTVQLCDRLLRQGVAESRPEEFLRSALAEVGAEYSVRWAAIVRRSPAWQVAAECGRRDGSDLPLTLLEEVLDRDAAVHQPAGEGDNLPLVAAPCVGSPTASAVLLLAGTGLTPDVLPRVLAVARALGVAAAFSLDRSGSARRVERLNSLLEIASSLARVRESRPLLELIAEEATRLIDCDRASIFIWDRDRHEVIACPALGVEDGTLRLPDDAGIVGEVIRSGACLRVDDAYNDSRFNRSVDDESGYRTRNLLCQPLKDADGQITGAFEVINSNGESFSEEDEYCLSLLCTQAAIALQNTLEREDLIRSRQRLAEQVGGAVEIIGESQAIASLRETIVRLADTDLPVLVLGESGTGKEVVAQSLHYRGPRAEKPFVAVNCAALSESLLESELFGHEQGSFTDARETRQGKFELADGGTLFLDEIGDMSAGGQTRLLRVLEQKVITRVGGSQTIPIDVRVVAATNANLVEAVKEKKFREDLYYRLNVVALDLLPLRERPEDILPLAQHFLTQFCAQSRRKSLRLSADARRRLQLHAWPGNVRELRNLMERVAFLSTGDKVEVDDLAFILSPERDTIDEPSLDLTLADATRQFQQEFIRRSIRRVRGNMSESARLLGLHRSNLYRKMRQLDMDEVGGFE